MLTWPAGLLVMVHVLVTGSNGSAGRCAATAIMEAGCVSPPLPLIAPDRRAVLAEADGARTAPQPLRPRLRPCSVRCKRRRCVRSERVGGEVSRKAERLCSGGADRQGGHR